MAEPIKRSNNERILKKKRISIRTRDDGKEWSLYRPRTRAAAKKLRVPGIIAISSDSEDSDELQVAPKILDSGKSSSVNTTSLLVEPKNRSNDTIEIETRGVDLVAHETLADRLSVFSQHFCSQCRSSSQNGVEVRKYVQSQSSVDAGHDEMDLYLSHNESATSSTWIDTSSSLHLCIGLSSVSDSYDRSNGIDAADWSTVFECGRLVYSSDDESFHSTGGHSLQGGNQQEFDSPNTIKNEPSDIASINLDGLVPLPGVPNDDTADNKIVFLACNALRYLSGNGGLAPQVKCEDPLDITRCDYTDFQTNELQVDPVYLIPKHEIDSTDEESSSDNANDHTDINKRNWLRWKQRTKFAMPGKRAKNWHFNYSDSDDETRSVTILTTLEQMGKPLKNYRYIVAESPKDDGLQSLKDTMMTDAEENKGNFLGHVLKLIKSMADATSHLLNSPQLAALKQEKFDLIIFGWFMNDFQIGLASHFNVPSVIISPMPNIKLMRDYVGNPTEVSSVAALHLKLKGPMTFMQRVKNFIFASIETVLVHVLQYFVMNPLYVQHFPPDKYPSYEDAKSNVSLVFINSHFTQGTPAALVPGFIEYSGMHIKRQPDPLPEDIKQWLDSATDGAILFSMGTNIKGTQLSSEKREAILRTFSKIKQKVLWKFEEDLPNKPANVMISKWLPQDDVLAHPNVKLFISHCGKGGLSEAKYHGIAVLGIPIFGDQMSNVEIAVEEGWAVQLLYSELTEKTFSDSLNEMLRNDTYSQVIKNLSLMFKDRPQHPLDTAAFWVEYVIRHHGAKHMQSPGVHLNFFQYYSLDVMAALSIVLYLSFKICKCAAKLLFRKCCGRSTKSKTE